MEDSEVVLPVASTAARALFTVDEFNGWLVGVVGVLDQAQAVDAGAGRLPPQEQTAGRPVVEVERPAGKGGLGGEAVSAAGGVEKLLVAGHRAGQRQLERNVSSGEESRNTSFSGSAAVTPSALAGF